MSYPDTYRQQTFEVDVDLDLSQNEGRIWSLSDADLTIDIDAVCRYPTTTTLRHAIAERHGVRPEQVLVTAGGDDALARCFLARSGTTVVATTPTFEMISHYSRQTGGYGIEVDWWEGDFPVDEFLDTSSHGADFAVIVSPNNPTGNVISEIALRKVAEAFPFVVLDAAYADFAGEDLTPTALEMGNVVVIRTLSKAFGMAGIRVGYLLGDPAAVGEISSFGSPFPVSGPSAALAEVALGADEEARMGYLERIRNERGRLIGLLTQLGVTALQSQANFVLATGLDSEWVVSAAASLGIGLRAFPGRAGLEDAVRITVPGEELDFERLSAALRAVLRPEGLIFDLDGVLADVSSSYEAAIVETAASLGIVVTHDDIVTARVQGFGNDDWALTQRLCETQGVKVGIDEITRRFQRLYRGTETEPGLSDRERPLVDYTTLERWSSRLPLAVVTGRPRREALEFLTRFGMLDIFSVIVTREDRPMKPDPAPVRLALERLGVRSAWMVGDTMDDIVAARGAGVVPIGVAPPGYSADSVKQGLRGAALVLDSVIQLEEVLNAQNI